MKLSSLMHEATGAITVPLDHLAAGGPTATEWTAFAGMVFFPATLLLLGVTRKLLNVAVPGWLMAAAALLALLGALSVYVALRPSEQSMKLFGMVIAIGLVGWLLSPKWRLDRSGDAYEERRPVMAVWIIGFGIVFYCSFVAGSGIEGWIEEMKADFAAVFIPGG